MFKTVATLLLAAMAFPSNGQGLEELQNTLEAVKAKVLAGRFMAVISLTTDFARPLEEELMPLRPVKKRTKQSYTWARSGHKIFFQNKAETRAWDNEWARLRTSSQSLCSTEDVWHASVSGFRPTP